MSLVRLRQTASAVSIVASLAPAVANAQSAVPATSQLVDPRNGGVAGTGLGKVPKTGAGGSASPQTSGTGASVSGPPGQGIHGQGGGQLNAAPEKPAGP